MPPESLARLLMWELANEREGCLMSIRIRGVLWDRGVGMVTAVENLRFQAPRA